VPWSVPLRPLLDPIQQRSRLLLTQSVACRQAEGLAGFGYDGKQFIDLRYDRGRHRILGI
jgi:hypothetical protein